jgi:hypothetical protein
MFLLAIPLGRAGAASIVCTLRSDIKKRRKRGKSLAALKERTPGKLFAIRQLVETLLVGSGAAS